MFASFLIITNTHSTLERSEIKIPHIRAFLKKSYDNISNIINGYGYNVFYVECVHMDAHTLQRFLILPYCFLNLQELHDNKNFPYEDI